MGATGAQRCLSMDELREVVAPIAEKYGADSVYLFGSRARGDNTDDSDYDFYVVLGRIHGTILCRLIKDLEGALGTKVDVITNESQLWNDFSQNIIRERKLVYESYGVRA